MPSQTLRPDAGRPEPGIDGTPIPPATYSAQEQDCGGNPAEVKLLGGVRRRRDRRAIYPRFGSAGVWPWSLGWHRGVLLGWRGPLRQS